MTSTGLNLQLLPNKKTDMTQDKIKEVLDLHLKWLKGERGGQRANLRGADLSGADLREANLRGANLIEADLSGANMSGADLSGASLYRTDLIGARLREANLYGTDLAGSNLYGTELSGANLYGTDLYRTNLSEANLSGANLSGADLREANLRGAKGILSFGPMKTSGRIIYAVWHNTGWMVQAGCFWGNLEETQKKVEKEHKDPLYLSIIELLQNYKPI